MVVIISSFFTTCTMYMTKIVQALCGQGIAHQGEFIIHNINIRRLEFHCSVQSGLCSSRSAEQRRLISQTAAGNQAYIPMKTKRQECCSYSYCIY